MKMTVQGIGVAGGFGYSLEALGDIRRLKNDAPRLVDTAALHRFVPPRALRRMDHFSKLALLGAHLALEDASSPDLSKKRTGIIIATGYGPTATTFQFLDGLLDAGASLVSPMAFAQSVHNIPAATIGIQLKLSGPCCTVSQFRASVLCGLTTARLWLAEDRVDHVLFGAIDEYTPLLTHCRSQHEKTPHSLPLGEGAAFFLLGSDQKTTKHGYIEGLLTASKHDLPSILQGRDVIVDRMPLSEQSEALCHAHHWGDMPIAQAFDMAFTLNRPMDGPYACLSYGRGGQSHCILLDCSKGQQ